MSGRTAHRGEAEERHSERQGVGTEVRCHGQRARAQDRPALRWVVKWVREVGNGELGIGEWAMKNGEWSGGNVWPFKRNTSVRNGHWRAKGGSHRLLMSIGVRRNKVEGSNRPNKRSNVIERGRPVFAKWVSGLRGSMLLLKERHKTW